MARPLSEDKRNAILNAATQAVAALGIGASTAGIAKGAGVAEGSLFTYFSTKDELLNQLYLHLKSEFRMMLITGYPGDADVKERCRHLWDRSIDWGAASPAKRKAMRQLAVSGKITGATRKAGAEGFRDMEAMLNEGFDTGVPAPSADCLHRRHHRIARRDGARIHRRRSRKNGKLQERRVRRFLGGHRRPVACLIFAQKMSEQSFIFHLTKEHDMSKIWLITGSANGLGRTIAEAVLRHGDRLVATARNPQQLSALKEQYGDQVAITALDVTDAAAANAAVQFAVDTFGRLDVLVNNAGYGNVAPFEQTTPEAFKAQIDTNFYGVVNLARAALPVMRGQRSGHIINISSVGGRIGTPGLSAYQSAKWAVGGFTEVLAMEAAAFGVKVIAVEPGGMRTNWGQVARGSVPAIMPDYEPSVGAITNLLKAYVGKEFGNPGKVAQVILDLANRTDLPPHLLLGSDALHMYKQTEAARSKAAADWEAVSTSTDFDGSDFFDFR